MSDNNIALKVWGEYACFTRPEMKAERVSYDVMTPSAARGILEAILWKPAIRWIVTAIDVLEPVRWISVRRNEVGSVIPASNVKTAMKTGSSDKLHLFVEEQRQQRAGLFLRDVAYVIHARFEMTDRAGQGDHPTKFREMFQRRAAKGQCFNQPYLGCREFSASFGLAQGDEQSLPGYTQDLGFMLHDLAFGDKETHPRFFRAQINDGRMLVPHPDSEEVRG